MTEDEKKALQVLEARIRQLMLMHDELGKENQALKSQLAEDEDMRKRIEENYQNLENSYNHLKMAKVISVGDSEARDTKQRLSKLVREVDKCIALLRTE